MAEFIFLSFPLDNETPVFGSNPKPTFSKKHKELGSHRCSSTGIEMDSHTGTHIDVPEHFISSGKTLDRFAASDFLFKKIFIQEIQMDRGRLIGNEDISNLNDKTELLFIKTNFSKVFRGQEKYRLDGPGFSARSAESILEQCPNLRAIGMDFISVTRFAEKEEGWEAHRIFLDQDIILIEDMDFSRIEKDTNLKQVIVAPLRIMGGDGAPATVFGEIA